MSLLKIGGIQLGQSNTASNNFHWRNLLDGLLRLSRGNAGSPITDVMRVKADNSVEFPGGISGVLGAGQTWQDVLASRVSGTTYTNSTGRPIMVSVSRKVGANNMTATVGGVIVARVEGYGLSDQDNLCFVVPAGQTYLVTASATPLGTWTELR